MMKKTRPADRKVIHQAIDAYETARTAWHAYSGVTDDEAFRLWAAHDAALGTLCRLLRASGHSCESKAIERNGTLYSATGQGTLPLRRVPAPQARVGKPKDAFVRGMCRPSGRSKS